MERASIDFLGFDIYMDEVIDLKIKTQIVIMRASQYYLPHVTECDASLLKFICPIKVESEKDFQMVRFEYIKYIKARPKPKDRVAPFECMAEDGIPDWDKMERLIEMRKTRHEKDREFAEELAIKRQCDKHKIEYYGQLKGDY